MKCICGHKETSLVSKENHSKKMCNYALHEFIDCYRSRSTKCLRNVLICKQGIRYNKSLVAVVEAQWLGGRMPDSRSRETGHESPTCNGAVDGDTLWRCYATTTSLYCRPT